MAEADIAVHDEAKIRNVEFRRGLKHPKNSVHSLRNASAPTYRRGGTTSNTTRLLSGTNTFMIASTSPALNADANRSSNALIAAVPRPGAGRVLLHRHIGCGDHPDHPRCRRQQNRICIVGRIVTLVEYFGRSQGGTCLLRRKIIDATPNCASANRAGTANVWPRLEKRAVQVTIRSNMRISLGKSALKTQPLAQRFRAVGPSDPDPPSRIPGYKYP
jgi:hypothetical protein